MSQGIDDLLCYLVQQVALRTKFGASTDYLINAVSTFYRQGNDGKPTAAGPRSNPATDLIFLEQVWSWLLQNPDISLGYRIEEPIESLTLDEVKRRNEKAAVQHSTPNATPEHAEELHPPALLLFASEEEIWRALTGHGVDQRKVSALEFTLLCAIAIFREKGVHQPELASMTYQDQRSVPKRTDKLADLGYIVKHSSHGEGHVTSRIILTTFAPTEQGPSYEDTWQGHKFGKWQSVIKQCLEYVKERQDQDVSWPEIRVHHQIKHDKTKASKTIITALERFALLGCVEVLRTSYAFTGGQVIDRISHLRYIRDVDDEQWQRFWDLPRDLSGMAGAGKLYAPYLAGASPAPTVHDDTINTNLQEDTAIMGIAAEIQRPLWNPDRTLVDASHAALKRAGVDGLISSQAILQVTGKFFNRPISNLLSDLSNSPWTGRGYTSQHLQVLRDAAQVHRHTTFTFFSFDSFSELVASGKKAWQYIGRHEPGDDAPDAFAFSRIDEDKFGDDGISDVTLTACLRNKIKGERLVAADLKVASSQKVRGKYRKPAVVNRDTVPEAEDVTKELIHTVNRKYKRKYTEEELASMSAKRAKDARNSVDTLTRYHYREVKKRLNLVLDQGEQLEAAITIVLRDLENKSGVRGEDAKLTQIEQLPIVAAEYRRKLYRPSISAHMPLYPGRGLERINPIPKTPKGRPVSKTAPKAKAKAKPPTDKVTQLQVVHSKPVKSNLGYYASVSAHSQPRPGQFDTELFAKAAPPKSKSAKAAIRSLFHVKCWKPSAASHTDFAYHVSQTNLWVNSTTSRKGRAQKIVAFETAEAHTDGLTPVQRIDSAEPAAVDPLPPAFSRSGRELKQTSKALVSAAIQESSAAPAKSRANVTSKPSKKSQGALTYEQQYSLVQKETAPGVFFGPPCTLKREVKGRGPRSFLAVFRSTVLREPLFLPATRIEKISVEVGEPPRIYASCHNALSSVPANDADPPQLTQLTDHTHRESSPPSSGIAQLGKRKRSSNTNSPAVTSKKARTSTPGPFADILENERSIGAQVGHAQMSGGPIRLGSLATTMFHRGRQPVVEKGWPETTTATTPIDQSVETATPSDAVIPEALDGISRTKRQSPEDIDAPLHWGQLPASIEAGDSMGTGIDSENVLLKELEKAAKNNDLAATSGLSQSDATNTVPKSVTAKRDQPVQAHPGNEPRAVLDALPQTTTLIPGKPPQKPRARRTQAKAGTGVSRHGGSLAAERKEIIMNIVTSAGGVFPSGLETWVAFTTQWQKNHGQNRPDSRTISTVEKALIMECKLKEHVFNFKDKSGGMKIKKLLLLPEIELTDPRLIDIKYNLKTSYPRPYMPSGIDFDAELRRERGNRGIQERPKLPGRPLAVDGDGNLMQLDSLTEGLNSTQKERLHKKKKAEQFRREQEEADELMGKPTFVIQGYQHGGPTALQQSENQGFDQFDMGMVRTRKRMTVTSMRDGEYDEGLHFVPLPYYSGPGSDKQQRADRLRTLELLHRGGFAATSAAAKAAQKAQRTQRKERAAPRLAKRPQPKPVETPTTNIGHQQLGEMLQETVGQLSTLGTNAEGLVKSAIAHRLGARANYKFQLESKLMHDLANAHLTSLQPNRTDYETRFFSATGTFGSFVDVPGWFSPRSLDEILHHTWPGKVVDCEPLLRTQAEKFSRIIDQIKQWELTDASSTIASSGKATRFINVTLASEISKSQRKIKSPRSKSAPQKERHTLGQGDRSAIPREYLLRDESSFHLPGAATVRLAARNMGDKSVSISGNGTIRTAVVHQQNTSDPGGMLLSGSTSESDGNDLSPAPVAPGRKRLVEEEETNGPQHAERITALQRPGGKRQLENPWEPVPKKRSRAQRERPEDSARDQRILLAVIMSRILFRAGDVRFTDWPIVERLLGGEIPENKIRKRYNVQRTPWKLWIAHTKRDLEERFLVAYAAGEVPPILYRDLDATQWTKIMDWVERQPLAARAGRKPKGSKQEAAIGLCNLSHSRQALNKAYKVKETPFATQADSFEYRAKGIRASRRRDWQHEYPDVTLIRRLRKPTDVLDETVSRSWVRANALTDKTNYNALVAREKLQSVPKLNIDAAFSQLLEGRWLVKKSVQIGHRKVDISGNFVANFRTNLEVLHCTHAVQYKISLDETFKEQQSVVFDEMAGDGHVIALYNMFAQGQLSFHAKGIQSKGMGHLIDNYKTRLLDKKFLHFEVEIRPTKQYLQGTFPRPLPSIPMPSKRTNSEGLDTTPLPVWISIHGQPLKTLWDAALNVLFSLCVIRPGLTAEEIAKYTWPSLEAWETRILMKWAVEARLAEWVGSEREGVKLRPTWWIWQGLEFPGL